jgi:DNA-directed RNA polymerase beta' subunit
MADENKVGGPAFEEMLEDIDVNKHLKSLLEEVKTVKSVSKGRFVKKIKYLAGLQKLKIKPHEAYIINNVPVVPPVTRPATNLGANRIEFSDVNQLYRDHMLVNNSLKDIARYAPGEPANKRA